MRSELWILRFHPLSEALLALLPVWVMHVSPINQKMWVARLHVLVNQRSSYRHLWNKVRLVGSQQCLYYGGPLYMTMGVLLTIMSHILEQAMNKHTWTGVDFSIHKSPYTHLHVHVYARCTVQISVRVRIVLIKAQVKHFTDLFTSSNKHCY